MWSRPNRNTMVKPNPIGHDQRSLNLHSSGEGLCSSALVSWNTFITFILLGQSLCLPARLHTLSLSHSPCSGAQSISECLLEQQAISSPGQPLRAAHPTGLHHAAIIESCHHLGSKTPLRSLSSAITKHCPVQSRTE